MDQHQAPSHLERKIAYIFFIFISGWWLYLFFNHITNSTPAYLFAATYGIMALLGGIWGLEISRKWGGTKSVMGKAITSMAFGLLAAEFGQIVFSFYNIFQNNQVPYPSLADIGFFCKYSTLLNWNSLFSARFRSPIYRTKTFSQNSDRASSYCYALPILLHVSSKI